MSNRRAGFVVMLVAINAGLFVHPLAAQQPAGIVAYDWCHSWGNMGSSAACSLSPGMDPTPSTSVITSPGRCGLRTDRALHLKAGLRSMC